MFYNYTYKPMALESINISRIQKDIDKLFSKIDNWNMIRGTLDIFDYLICGIGDNKFYIHIYLTSGYNINYDCFSCFIKSMTGDSPTTSTEYEYNFKLKKHNIDHISIVATNIDSTNCKLDLYVTYTFDRLDSNKSLLLDKIIYLKKHKDSDVNIILTNIDKYMISCNNHKLLRYLYKIFESIFSTDDISDLILTYLFTLKI